MAIKPVISDTTYSNVDSILVLGTNLSSMTKVVNITNGGTTSTIWSKPITIIKNGDKGELALSSAKGTNSEPTDGGRTGPNNNYTETGSITAYYNDTLTIKHRGITEFGYTYYLSSMILKFLKGSFYTGYSEDVTELAQGGTVYHYMGDFPTVDYDTIRIDLTYYAHSWPYYSYATPRGYTDYGLCKRYKTSSTSGWNVIVYKNYNTGSLWTGGQYFWPEYTESADGYYACGVGFIGTISNTYVWDPGTQVYAHISGNTYEIDPPASANRGYDYKFTGGAWRIAAEVDEDFLISYDGVVHFEEVAKYSGYAASNPVMTIRYLPRTLGDFDEVHIKQGADWDFYPGSSTDNHAWTKASTAYSIPRGWEPETSSRTTITKATYDNYQTSFWVSKQGYHQGDAPSHDNKYVAILFNMDIVGAGSSTLGKGTTHFTIDCSACRESTKNTPESIVFADAQEYALSEYGHYITFTDLVCSGMTISFDVTASAQIDGTNVGLYIIVVFRRPYYPQS